VGRTVDVGVLAAVIRHEGVDHLAGLLGGCRAIQIDKRMPIYLGREDWEVATDYVDVQGRMFGDRCSLVGDDHARSFSTLTWTPAPNQMETPAPRPLPRMRERGVCQATWT